MSGCDCVDVGVFGHRCWQLPAALTTPEFVSALCVDGPARGQVIRVPATSPYYYVVDYGQMAEMAVLAGTPWSIPDLPVVSYRLTRYGFRSGESTVMIRLASSAPGEPDARDLADLLLSDAAKAALMPLRCRDLLEELVFSTARPEVCVPGDHLTPESVRLVIQGDRAAPVTEREGVLGYGA